MFDLPQAKRVRRDELTSSPDSPSPDLEEYEDAAQRRLRELFSAEEKGFGLDYIDASNDNASKSLSHMTEEDAFEFRLFAVPKATKEPSQSLETSRIAIRSPSPDRRSPGFLVASRPITHYLAEAPNQDKAEKLQAAAISGEDVMRESRKRWLGSELPWRVITIHGKHKAELKKSSTPSAEVEKRNTRPRDGKKRRIAIRKKLAFTKSKQEQDAIEKATREAVEKEKRTLRNREKKVKKKARDKAKRSSMLSEASESCKVPNTT